MRQARRYVAFAKGSTALRNFTIKCNFERKMQKRATPLRIHLSVAQLFFSSAKVITVSDGDVYSVYIESIVSTYKLSYFDLN